MTSRYRLRSRVAAGSAVLAAVVALVPVTAHPAFAFPAANVLLSGHGWGHGRGMGQWGAYGYAQAGWSATQILDHFYSNTTMGNAGNPNVSVRLTGFPADLITQQERGHLQVTTPNGGVGLPGNTIAARVRRLGVNSFAVDSSTGGCGGPWNQVVAATAGPVTVNPTSPPASTLTTDADDAGPNPQHAEMLQGCESDAAHWMRGSLQAVEGNGGIRILNVLALEQYVQGVVPVESPSSWPAAALQAQAVAARSYGWSTVLGTGSICDTTACQVYRGFSSQAGSTYTRWEQVSSDAAAGATAGSVRMLNGGVARTEFSSSTGGFSAGGTFPAVDDAGDAVSGNPNHSWSASISVSAVQQAYPSIGQLSAIDVTQRNGLGDWGGRVLQVVVRGTGGNVTVSGDQFQSTFGLKSNWFTVVNNPSGGLSGYWVAARDGGVFTFGNARFYGSTGNVRLNQPVVGMAATSTGRGYWLVASDGGIFQFGDAPFFGSTGNVRLNKPVVGMAVTPTGRGYWLVASDGGIFQFGDAPFFGSTGSVRLNKPVVGMAVTPTGRGYWLVASDGGIFQFGDAQFFGSTGNVKLNQPIVGMAARPQGDGYWLFARDGGVFNMGNAPFAGSLPGAGQPGPVGGGHATATGGGYLMVTNDGRVYPFGDAPNFGSIKEQIPNYNGTALALDTLVGSG